MSPNLSSGHFKPNKRFYEQVVYNLLAVVGVARSVHHNHLGEEYVSFDFQLVFEFLMAEILHMN